MSRRKRINPDLSEGLDGDQWQLVLGDIRGHLRNAGDWKRLASEAGVVKQTISNIAYGVTKFPRFSTVYKLMVALGRGEQLLEAIASEDPMSLTEAKKRRPKAVREKVKKIEARREARAAERENEKASKKKPRRRRAA